MDAKKIMDEAVLDRLVSQTAYNGRVIVDESVTDRLAKLTMVEVVKAMKG